jgi:hypothetical protein
MVGAQLEFHALTQEFYALTPTLVRRMTAEMRQTA